MIKRTSGKDCTRVSWAELKDSGQHVNADWPVFLFFLRVTRAKNASNAPQTNGRGFVGGHMAAVSSNGQSAWFSANGLETDRQSQPMHWTASTLKTINRTSEIERSCFDASPATQ
jgi:hypothetical protein